MACHNKSQPDLPQGRIRDLLTILRRQTNGEVSAAMTRLGIHYATNYGVSVVDIRRCAKPYAPDHAMAKELFLSPIRELILSATVIADPQALTECELGFWASGISNTEVAEHLASNFLGRTPLAPAIFQTWLPDPKLAYCAILTALRYCILGGDPARLEIEPRRTILESLTSPTEKRAAESLLDFLADAQL